MSWFEILLSYSLPRGGDVHGRTAIAGNRKSEAIQRARVGTGILPVLIFCATAGCGFHLRGSGGALLPPTLATLRVVMTGTTINQPLAVAVREAVTQAGAKVVESGDVPTLSLLEERIESQVAAVRTTTGKASEYTLRYAVSFRLDGTQLVPVQTIRLQRDYSFDPNNIIAKEQEERDLQRDLRRDAAQQIVRRLARAVAPSAK
jgi:LPS-assembly lipoprotein